MSENPYRLNIDQIQKFLPHRAPFLLVDRILEIHPQGNLDDLSATDKVGVKVRGQKAVCFNEPYFAGHFPKFAVVPGVLIVETMAQVASFSLYPYLHRDIAAGNKQFQCILVGVDGARFRRPVVPGDTMVIESTVTKVRGKLWAFSCSVTVDQQRAAEAEIIANLIENTEVA